MNKVFYKIRFGENQDIPQIMQLNKKWLVTNIMDAHKSNGFLFGDPLKQMDLEKIILAKELTVALFNEKVIGYYLFDNYSDTEILRQYTQYINKLTDEGFINKGLKISKRAQAVVEKEFQKIGLSKELLNELLKETKKKYDVLFSVVSKQNPKIIAHQKAGWKIIAENDDLYFVQFVLLQTK